MTGRRLTAPVAWSHDSCYGAESWTAELGEDADLFASATHHVLDAGWRWSIQGFRSDRNIADVLAAGRAPPPPRRPRPPSWPPSGTSADRLLRSGLTGVSMRVCRPPETS